MLYQQKTQSAPKPGFSTAKTVVTFMGKMAHVDKSNSFVRCGLERELLDPVVKSRDFGGRLGGLWGKKMVVAWKRVPGIHILSRR